MDRPTKRARHGEAASVVSHVLASSGAGGDVGAGGGAGGGGGKQAAVSSDQLPAGWVVCHSKRTGQPYVFNQYTGQAAWDSVGPRIPRGVSLGPRVAVIVPFRDLHKLQQRTAHRRKFVPHMLRFLSSACKLRDFTIMLVNQSNDGRKFNRGKLLNIGFDLLQHSHDTFILHDVDLLPGDDLGSSYSSWLEERQTLHIARCWDRYSNNEKYFGGIVSFRRDDFRAINGFPNNYWGWGGEDDELFKRTTACKLNISAPSAGTITDLEAMNLKQKLAVLHDNKEWTNQVKHELLKEHAATWRTNGLEDLKYSVLDERPLCDSHRAVMVTVDVQLNGHWSDSVFHWKDLPQNKHLLTTG